MIEMISIKEICLIAELAGEKIIEVYDSEFAVETKDDQSPLTLADKQSHQIIVEHLKQLFPDVPILSEEGNHLPYDQRKAWEYLWVVDPLDGTKEFVKRNGEFTVNIALVHRGKPVLGVIYAPILNTMFCAKQGLGAFKIEDFKSVGAINDKQLLNAAQKLPIQEKRDKLKAVASRSHMSEETKAYIEKLKAHYGEVEITSAGSSLKLCLVAEGKADVYPRFAPTMEWDTAAGQAIIEQSGGTIIKTDEEKALMYNKEDLLNPWFIAKKKGFSF